MPTRLAVEKTIKELLARYNAEYALLFGSYARGDETPESDIDIVVFGGDHFKKTDIFAFVEDLREALATNADVFEISGVNRLLVFEPPEVGRHRRFIVLSGFMRFFAH